MFTQLALEFNRNPQLDDDQGFEDIPSVKCPFDASHIMQPKNLLTHINRCQSPNKYLYIQCKYDPCHWIYPEQKIKHYQQCPTKKEYYSDLDLEEGDWDEQEAIKKMQETALKQKKEKRKKKLIKIIAFLKMKKKLKNQKKLKEQQFCESFDNLSQISYKQESYNQDIEGLSVCSEDRKELNNFVNFKKKIKNDSQTTKDKSSINKQTPTHQNQNLPKFIKQKNLPNIQLYPSQKQCPPFGLIKNEFQFSPQVTQHYSPPIYFQQFSFMNINPLPHSGTFINQKPPFINPQSSYKPHYLTFQQRYPFQPEWQFLINTHSLRVKKPESDNTLKFEEISNTEEFVKRSIHQQKAQYFIKSNNDENTRFSSQIYQKTHFPSDSSYQNFIPQQKQKNKNEDKQKVKPKAHQVSTNSKLEKSQNQKKQKILNACKEQSRKEHLYKKDESSSEMIGKKLKEKKQKKCKINNGECDTKKSSINLKTSSKMPEFTRFLDSSISGYDFYPNLHQSINTTIKSQSMSFSENSQFLDMKQMLEALQNKKGVNINQKNFERANK